MAIEITVPRLGWNMEQGVFGGWLKQDGEAVHAGDELFRLESDKATEDVAALDSGVLHIPADGPHEGDVLAVGAVIGHLIPAGEAAPVERCKPREEPASPSVRRLARELGVDLQQVSGTGSGGRIVGDDVRRSSTVALPTVSPRARRVAAELNVDWARLQGSGRTGRIRERDVRAAAGRRQASPAATTKPSVRSHRHVIAERMLQSVRSTAPVTLTTRVDASNLVNLRGQFQTAADAVPTYTDFFVKLTAVALRRHPHLNSRWDGDAIIVEPDVNIGIAVDTDAGLLVPVIRGVPGLGLRQLAGRSCELIERARQGKLSAEEMQGGTFTVTNLGSFGIDAFTPIIRYPECAILGVGRIERQAVVVAEQVTARDMVTLSLTFDHRIVDGAPAARFLQALGQLLENPGPALMG